MKDETKLATLGRDPDGHHGAVNIPVYRASTILQPDLKTLAETYAARARDEQVTSYGRIGTPLTYAFENTVAEIEGGYRAISFPSGAAACSGAILSVVKAGDHILVTDSAYGPTRHFCDTVLKRLGVETQYFDPLIGAGLRDMLRPNTSLVFLESPGSLTFEIQDVPAIVDAAHRHGAKVAIDNTWGTPLYFKSFSHGVDLSIHAATKYIVGHSDAMLGVVIATKESWPMLRDSTRAIGTNAGPDEIYLGLRGIRTLAVRLPRHMESGIRVAEWLRGRPEVVRVLHPALPDDPGHAIWKRDFLGACGLFSFELDRKYGDEAVAAFVDHLELFGIGYSWGGFESLITVAKPHALRTANPWKDRGALLRLHIGLEATEDLIADLRAGFERLNKAQG
ncbi:MAG TPA: cystathionine beta-lyase [Ferrovibrio sp.]|jgi:cystathionine beta-lyase|uniref:cystathionine beta-lyase n=1 Tax=Ferrovibrio sp. TaxID=1917215 RepID=UPI002B4AFE95|nr:cystathionine beta-lyase [Ferrovibrio sp.]HLT77339.1 cystathionine beta-lyase [Ferrovibrio sp.]